MNSARELTSRLADLLRREHGALADFLVALSDFDRCRLWEELGHPSLFQFLRVELGLSKGAAHYRKVAAELVQRETPGAASTRSSRGESAARRSASSFTTSYPVRSADRRRSRTSRCAAGSTMTSRRATTTGRPS